MNRQIPLYRPSRPSPSRAGFSLVEMAVVLTIIALITGGIMVGRNMLRSAEIQATTSRIFEYRSAINNFTDRYMELPGDFHSATTYWPDTRNGNGDGRIGGAAPSSSTCTPISSQESWAAFDHMSRAELLDGRFDPSITTPSPGRNTPATPIENGGYTLTFCGDVSSGSVYFPGYYGHMIHVGSALTRYGTVLDTTRGPLFTAAEAGAIDTKMDDGFPATGTIRAPQPTDNATLDCTVSASGGTPADYFYNYTGDLPKQRCPVFFLLGF